MKRPSIQPNNPSDAALPLSVRPGCGQTRVSLAPALRNLPAARSTAAETVVVRALSLNRET